MAKTIRKGKKVNTVAAQNDGNGGGDKTAVRIAEMVLEALDKGVSPWHKAWKGGMMPQSAITGRAYRGINVFLLGMLPYEVPRYLTFKQCTELGGKVKKGEHGHLVQFWKPMKKVEKDEATGDEKTRHFLLNKSYIVFNVAQCEGLPEKFYKGLELKNHEPIKEAEAMWDGYEDKPNTSFTDGDSAFYVPSADIINVPKMGQFDSPEAFYATLFHEGVHSTGHEKRLNRKSFSQFGTEKYSEEELTAELGAQLLCQMCGITTTLENSAAYCKSWAKFLRENRARVILDAASRAQKAVDYMTGKLKKEGGEKAEDGE